MGQQTDFFVPIVDILFHRSYNVFRCFQTQQTESHTMKKPFVFISDSTQDVDVET